MENGLTDVITVIDSVTGNILNCQGWPSESLEPLKTVNVSGWCQRDAAEEGRREMRQKSRSQRD